MDDFWVTFWTFAERPVTALAIVVVALIVRYIAGFVIDRVVQRIVHGIKKRQGVEDTQAIDTSPLAAARTVQRTRTLGLVLNNIVTTAIIIIATLAVLTTLLPDVTGAFALITAALGAGLGFGAQNIIKDVLNGLFMVAEDQVGVGDVVDTGPATGIVENVGIRVTQIRDVNGTLWYVRNGEILRVGNMSQGWQRVIVDLAVPYDADIEAVEDRILQTAIGLSKETKWKPLIIERPEIWGLESISAEALVIRLVVKTRSGAKDDVARELRPRLKRALDEMDVTLPHLNTVVLSGFEEATSVRGARAPKTGPVAAVEAPPKKPRTRRTPPAE
ncbi:mechanosensitive ion channel family protein [Herbiconiux sp. SYSU D00978]|uniref:mechanosensitive ion channel family protein n=1 Tax=Herbiconiux sp. SYSU D00978 TaxID=2812562 RepID=UPI001A9641D6|nr:mechanosensitive ion channel domain-containing protein [Herbiconiux sp. SYSU D00978]